MRKTFLLCALIAALVAPVTLAPAIAADGPATAPPGGDRYTLPTVAGPVTITTSAGRFRNLAGVEQPAGAPSGYAYPVGWFGFEVVGVPRGGSTNVTLELPAAAGAVTGAVKCAAACAPYAGTTVGANGSSVTVALTDGGTGDADGKADGRIADPVAPARAIQAPACPLPAGTSTLSEWDGTMGVAVAGLGVTGDDDVRTFALPAGCTVASLTVRIAWDRFTEDLDLEVTDPSGTKRVSEDANAVTAAAEESLPYPSPAAGTYTARTYAYVTANTAYHGEAIVEVAAASSDADFDGVDDAADNCAAVYNPSQADGDADGNGDACDTPPVEPAPDATTKVFEANGTTGVSVQPPPLGPLADFQGTGYTVGGQLEHRYTLTLSSVYTDYRELNVHLDWPLELKDYLTLDVRAPGGAISSSIFVNTNYQEVTLADPEPGEYLLLVRESRTTTGEFTLTGNLTRSTKPDLGPIPPIVSDPARPRVVVADLDTGINPYHSFYYGGSEIYPNAHPSAVTQEVLDALGVKPENVVTLTRTGNIAADIAADAAFWNRVVRGELYHFRGTNIIAVSYVGDGESVLKPDPARSPHGVGTSSAVLRANPDAVMLMVEQGDDIGNEPSHAFAFGNPAVDIVTTSYGVSAPEIGFPLPEYRAFEHSYDGVVGGGKLHFSSGGNGPGLTPMRAGAGPWWSIGVSGIEEGSSEGDSALSGEFPDFVSDFTQDLPYCFDCSAGYETVAGTSFSTPRAAGVASRVLYEARRAAGHVGGITVVDGTPVMVGSSGTSGTSGTITNWQLRRALEQAAWTPDSLAYDPVDGVLDVVGLPIAPVAPWLETGWGDLTALPSKGVVPAALAELGIGDGAHRAKPTGYCEFQTTIVKERKLYWDTLAPTLPDNPILGGETPPGAPAQDPFVYC